jgi:hypothetical protein
MTAMTRIVCFVQGTGTPRSLMLSASRLPSRLRVGVL